MSKTLKNILIVGVILIILVAGYFFFFSKSAPTPDETPESDLQSGRGAPITGIENPNVSTSTIEASKIGQEFVNQLLNLQAIKLDDAIFSSLAFQSLEDFTIILIQPGNEGRPNPFAPFGSDETAPDLPQDITPPAGNINVFPIDQLPSDNTN